MKKIVTAKESVQIAKKLHKRGKHVVLVGGCFDVLHAGHISFMDKAKKEGDILMVLLESDESVKKLKGEPRPVNAQKDRANILAAIAFVDYTVLLDGVFTDKKYDALVQKIRPYVLATTKGDPGIVHKKRQAKLVGGKVAVVVERMPQYGTSRFAKLLLKG